MSTAMSAPTQRGVLLGGLSYVLVTDFETGHPTAGKVAE
jgi:hypothetical protein